MAYCAGCQEEDPGIMNYFPFCRKKRHFLYRFACPGDVAASIREGETGRVTVEVRNTGAWDVLLRAELTGPLAEKGAQVTPSGTVACDIEETIEFTIQLPAGRLGGVAEDVLEGDIRILLDESRHATARREDVRSNLPVIPIRLELARPKLAVEPPALEFAHGQGARALKIRNTGNESCRARADLNLTSAELEVATGAFPCEVGEDPYSLKVGVRWPNIPPGPGPHEFRLVLNPEHPACGPITIPVIAAGQGHAANHVSIGVDFGTSKTVIACIPPDAPGSNFAEPVLIEGHEQVPTVVAMRRTDPDDRYWGVVADSLRTNTRQYAILRSMKLQLASGGEYAILRHNPETGQKEPVATYSAEEVSAYYLHELLTAARHALRGLFGDPTLEIGDVVLTHPAKWNDAQRKATVGIFSAAGIAIRRLETRNEARAAAMSALQQHVDEPELKILVYDMGAGTLDATVVLKTTQGARILYREDGAADGEKESCAGDFFDRQIAVDLTRQLNAKFGCRYDYDELANASLETDERALAEEIRGHARDVKEKLSSFTTVPLHGQVTLPGGDRQFLDATVTRHDFESWIRDRVRDVTRQVLDNLFTATTVTRGREDIDLVLLVGGSVQVPLVEAIVREYFSGCAARVLVHLRPELAVGLGAAIEANQLVELDQDAESAEGRLSVENMQHSVGLEGVSGSFIPLAKRGEPCARNYVTRRALSGRGSSLHLRLLEYRGPVKDPARHEALIIARKDDWHPLAAGRLEIPPGYPSNSVAVLEVDVDAGGKLQVRAYCQTPDQRRTGPAVELVSRDF